MTKIKNLNKNIVKKYEDFHLREDLNVEDDGNHFRGFDYKGLPITTLRTGDKTYLDIDIYYLDDIQFTWREWRETEESKLTGEFNGCDEVDLEKLIDNCERIIAKVNELNEMAKADVVDMTEVKKRLAVEYELIYRTVKDAKNDLKWWQLEKYDLNRAKDNMNYLIGIGNRIAKFNEFTLSRRRKKELCEMLEEYGFVKLSENDSSVKNLKEMIMKQQ